MYDNLNKSKQMNGVELSVLQCEKFLKLFNHEIGLV